MAESFEQIIRQFAGNCCEYCRVPQGLTRMRHVLDHDRQAVRITIGEFESLMTPQTVPQFRAKWETIKSRIVEGDELWIVCSPKRDWARLAGAEWLSHMRNGIEISKLVMMRN